MITTSETDNMLHLAPQVGCDKSSRQARGDTRAGRSNKTGMRTWYSRYQMEILEAGDRTGSYSICVALGGLIDPYICEKDAREKHRYY